MLLAHPSECYQLLSLVDNHQTLLLTRTPRSQLQRQLHKRRSAAPKAGLQVVNRAWIASGREGRSERAARFLIGCRPGTSGGRTSSAQADAECEVAASMEQ